ncbi:hypothetical protein [Salinimicrobium sp. GXAS 041]|uniref:hypothetical protein n=1 Tax=Salinimicrobium sp. GXAS 041 TaxID=3400806 RepID=UPI003C788368
MKKITLLFLFFLTLLSCSPDDGDQNAMVNVLVPVTNVNLPEYFAEGVTYTIEITYSPPSSCHQFAGIESESEGHEYFFGVMNSYPPNDASCEEENGLTRQTSFSFTPEPNDFYIFNFWRGQDAAGNSRFLRLKIPVEPASESRN